MVTEMKMPVDLSPAIMGEIIRIGNLRLPNEACGVIIPTPFKGQQVFEMPNRSKLPAESFVMHSEDITLTIMDWAADNPDAVWEKMVIWHTHPSGGVGPSKNDLDNRIEHCGNLVVSLGEQPKATWF